MMIIRFIKLAALFLIVIVHIAKSQDLGFGLKAGLNFSNLNVKDPEGSYNSRTGYHAGIFLREKINKIAVQPEVLIFTQRNEIQNYGALGTVENSFTYLSIPIILKFYPISGLNIQAGPQFGFLLDGEQKYDNLLGTGKNDITDSYKKSDVSLSFGGGFDFGFGLNIDVRYNLGIKDINNLANEEKVKSRVFLISLGWNFMK